MFTDATVQPLDAEHSVPPMGFLLQEIGPFSLNILDGNLVPSRAP